MRRTTNALASCCLLMLGACGEDDSSVAGAAGHGSERRPERSRRERGDRGHYGQRGNRRCCGNRRQRRKRGQQWRRAGQPARAPPMPEAAVRVAPARVQWTAVTAVPGIRWVPSPESQSESEIAARFRSGFHSASGSNALTPDDAKLESGETRDYDAPKPFQSARVTAYKEGPRRGEADKVELNIGADGTIHYNITYVDWLELPAEMWGFGGDCQNDDKIGCYVPVAHVLSGCPEPFLLDGARCNAARSYCLNAGNQSSAYCHALDSAISACSQCPAGTTTQVYACSGPYGGNPRACAALNRGMASDFDETDESRYYQIRPTTPTPSGCRPSALGSTVSPTTTFTTRPVFVPVNPPSSALASAPEVDAWP